MAAVMAPRLEVVGDGDELETVPLSADAVIDQLMGGNCSADALYPYRSVPCVLEVMPTSSKAAHTVTAGGRLRRLRVP